MCDLVPFAQFKKTWKTPMALYGNIFNYYIKLLSLSLKLMRYRDCKE